MAGDYGGWRELWSAARGPGCPRYVASGGTVFALRSGYGRNHQPLGSWSGVDYQIRQGRIYWPGRFDTPEGYGRATPHDRFYHARTRDPTRPLPGHAGWAGHWRSHQWYH